MRETVSSCNRRLTESVLCWRWGCHSEQAHPFLPESTGLEEDACSSNHEINVLLESMNLEMKQKPPVMREKIPPPNPVWKVMGTSREASSSKEIMLE